MGHHSRARIPNLAKPTVPAKVGFAGVLIRFEQRNQGFFALVQFDENVSAQALAVRDDHMDHRATDGLLEVLDDRDQLLAEMSISTPGFAVEDVPITTVQIKLF